MISADGRFVISYNGEAYNASELRRALLAKGYAFRGRSDTEAIVNGCAAWGVKGCVDRLIGMFAFALWDRRERTLTLVRDRMGIKPLYWGHCGALLLFGSELKSLRAHPDWMPEIDRAALASYMRYGYVLAPRSIYRNVFKLEPGSLLTFRAGHAPRVTRYWDMQAVARDAQAAGFDSDDAEAVDELEGLLRDAVRMRMMSDVPLGAFLSGGINSSTVVALMQAQSERPIKTFTIGFREAGYDEAAHAKAIAAHLGTQHTELYVSDEAARDVIPCLPELFDEPFGDSSEIATFILARLTRRDVTVALSGDGGDELFAGYNRYVKTLRLWYYFRRVPIGVRRLVGALLAADLPSPCPDRADRAAPPRLARAARRTRQKVRQLGAFLTADDCNTLYRHAVTRWPVDVVQGASEAGGFLCEPWVVGDVLDDPLGRMQLFDALTYLPDDILTKVDRATMGSALEARVPLLDHRVVEFAFRLPRHLKMRRGVGKWLLRQVLYRHVPRHLVERPKMGFGVPIDAWLRGRLKDWAAALLDEQRLRQEGFFEPAPILSKWREHLSGGYDWQYHLWPVLMFQAWSEGEAGAGGTALARLQAPSPWVVGVDGERRAS